MLKRLMLGLSLAATLSFLAPVSQADASWDGWWSRWQARRQERIERYREWRDSRIESRGVPELDPGAAGSAIVLVIGGVAYIASRRREEDAA